MKSNWNRIVKIWQSTFGKVSKVKDFAGREIALNAYGEINSKYGWNFDHMCPLSKGGTNALTNIICCHILTNQEKKDDYPEFKANGKSFCVKGEEKKSIVELLDDKKAVDQKKATKEATKETAKKATKNSNVDLEQVRKETYQIGFVEAIIKATKMLQDCGKTDKQIANMIVKYYDIPQNLNI